MSNATCRGCDAVDLDPTTPHGGAWCGIRCYWRMKDTRKAMKRTPETERICTICRVTFSVPPPGRRTKGSLPKTCPEHRGVRRGGRRRKPKPPAPTSEKPCGHCGATFTGTPKRVYCSEHCAKAIKVARNNAKRSQERAAARAALPPKPPKCPIVGLQVGSLTCAHCGTWEAFIGTATNRKLCRPCKVAGKYPPRPKPPKARKPPVTPCAECGCDFQPLLTTHKFCTPKCSKRNHRRQRKQAERAGQRPGAVEMIDRVRVGERDGWKCGICAKRVNRNLQYPHPKSQSLDHVIPLSLGGTHEMRNVQIAHLDCNVSKGNNPANEQLRLIGA